MEKQVPDRTNSISVCRSLLLHRKQQKALDMVCILWLMNIQSICQTVSHYMYKKTSFGAILASFPGLPTVQFLIVCSMQNKGGRPGSISHANDVSVYQGRQRGGEEFLIERTHFGHVLSFEPRAVCFSLQNLKLQDQASSLFFQWGTLRASVYLGRH